MIKIIYTRNEDDTTFVQGPYRTLLVCHNGDDYSVHKWSNHHRCWTDIVVEHAGDFSAAIERAKALTCQKVM